jgi:hypothetical protein
MKLRIPVVLCLFTLVIPSAVGSQITYLTHAGQLVDDRTGDGIEAVAVAYDSDTRAAGGARRCAITNGRLLDLQLSDSVGRFTFYVPSDQPTYMAVYCKNGYVPEFRSNNDNRDGLDVNGGVPIRLMRRPD